MNYLSMIKRYTKIANIEMDQETRRDFLGVLWLPISYIILCYVLTAVFMTGRGDTLDQFAYVYSGFIFWMTLNKAVMVATTFLPGKLNHYFQNNVRFSEAYLITALKSIYIIVLNIPFLLVILLYKGNLNILWVVQLIIMLIMLFIFLVSVTWIVSVLCAVYKGLGGIVSLGMRFLFFASPVFWSVDTLSNNSKMILYLYNPISYLLSSFRQIVLIQSIELYNLIISIALIVLITVVSATLYLLVGKQIKNVS